MRTVNNVYDLEVWKKARELRQNISVLVRSFPSREQFALKDQIVRSSRSITANIAEGFGRHHNREAAQYYRQARGSLVETMDHLICAYDESYISKANLQEFLQHIEECEKLLNGLIRYQIQHGKKLQNKAKH